jgi:ribose-phosphate pyrophosphokinase
LKLFALNDTREWGLKLAARLDVPLASHEERSFEDGEFKIRALESVRGERVFVCASLAAEAPLSACDKLCRLAFFCGSLKDAGAARAIAVLPYLAFWRKDKRTKPRDPVTTRYVARMLEAAGIDGVLALDVHSPAAFDNAFHCPTENLDAAPIFAEHFAALAGGAAKVVVLSPDAGGVHRARSFAALLAERTRRAIDLAFLEKQRSEGRVSGELFAGDVGGADVIVFDDLIAAGTTIARAAAACAARGARSVRAAATHGVLAPGAVQALNGAGLASLTLADTVGGLRRRCDGLRVDLHVLETTPLFAGAIERWAGEREIAADSPLDAD